MEVLVTGAAGHIGCAVTRALLAEGHRVRALVHRRGKASRRLAGLELDLVMGDVRDLAALHVAVEGMEAVVHLAGVGSERGAADFEAVNEQGTRNLVEVMARTGVARIVFLSHAGARATVPDRFLRSKALAQAAVQAADMAWTILRPSVVFGPTDAFTTVLARWAKLAPALPVAGDGQAISQPISRDDVADGVARVLTDELALGAVYDLGGPEVLSFNTVLERILEAMGSHRAVLHLSPGILRAAVPVYERLLSGGGAGAGLLECMTVDQVDGENRAEALLGRSPAAFAGANLRYLHRIGFREAIRGFDN